jgi:hypothetical protein
LKAQRPLEIEDIPGAQLFLHKQVTLILLLLSITFSLHAQEVDCNHCMSSYAKLVQERDLVSY